MNPPWYARPRLNMIASIVGMVAAAVLLVGLLAGCGGSSAPSGVQAPSVPAPCVNALKQADKLLGVLHDYAAATATQNETFESWVVGDAKDGAMSDAVVEYGKALTPIAARITSASNQYRAYAAQCRDAAAE